MPQKNLPPVFRLCERTPIPGRHVWCLLVTMWCKNLFRAARETTEPGRRYIRYQIGVPIVEIFTSRLVTESIFKKELSLVGGLSGYHDEALQFANPQL